VALAVNSLGPFSDVQQPGDGSGRGGPAYFNIGTRVQACCAKLGIERTAAAYGLACLPGGTSMDWRSSFLARLAGLEQWLANDQIPYAVFGSMAAAAWTDQGMSLDFDRPGARDPAERIPDIDLLVPRSSLDKVKRYARAARCSEFPVRSGLNAGSTSARVRSSPS